MFPDDLARERKPHNPFVDLLLDVLPDPALVLETQNEGAPTIYGANPAFFHLMGLGEKDRILGQSFLEYLDPSDKTPLLFPDGTDPGDWAEPFQKERVLMRKGQGRFLSELRMKRLVNGGESLCLVMVRDITEIHQREAFETISREIEHYLKNEIPLESLTAFVIRNISGTFPFPEVSFSHEKSGIQPVESAGSGTPFAHLYRRVFTLRENEFAKGEESITMEVRFRNSGDWTPSFLSCLDGFSGKMDKALEHFSQFQPRAEKDALFELAPDGICLIDFDSLKIIGTNPVFCRLMGFPVFDTFVNALSVPVPYEARLLNAPVSIGVSRFPKEAGSAEEMIQKADMAMYCSKSKGKNTWCFYQENLEKARESNAPDQ